MTPNMNRCVAVFALLVAVASVSCTRYAPVHGPGVAPPAAVVDEQRLVEDLEADGYRGARLDHLGPPPPPTDPTTEAPPAVAHGIPNDGDDLHATALGDRSLSVLRITIPGPVDVADPAAFLRKFANRHSASLAFGIGRAVAVGSAEPGTAILADSFPQRDAGCLYVLLRVATTPTGPRAPLVIDRECRRAQRSPPPYRARSLPSTANGPVDVIARCGFSGGVVPAYGGFALDKFGDVYEMSLRYSTRRYDLAWADGQDNAGGLINVLYHYVRTMPPSEVDQLMRDVAAAEDGVTSEKGGAYGELQCTGVVIAPPAPRTVYLDPERGGATKRARVALLEVLR